MYNPEHLVIPANEDELWNLLEEQFLALRLVLWETPVETKEEALTRKYRDGAMSYIHYRGISADYDNREYYLKAGRELLPYIHQSIDERKLTPEFVQQWGKICFCHGYIASYFFDDSDDMANKRGGHRTGKKRSEQSTAQKKWIATMLSELKASGLTRQDAEDRVISYIRDILHRFETEPGFAHTPTGKFGKKWFEDLLNDCRLASQFEYKNFYPKIILQYASDIDHDIPPVPSSIP